MEQEGEVNGPFDAAIRELAGLRCMMAYSEDEKRGFAQAIRVLEAAGNAENKSLMKLTQDLGVPFSAAKIIHDHAIGPCGPMIEAAGKLDSFDSIHTLDLLADEWYATSGGDAPDVEANARMKKSVDAIRSLLESLPEEK